MRHIAKGGPHYALGYRNKHPPATAEEAEVAWKNFRGERSRTRERCLSEQYGLCGYSELLLEDGGLGMHLEHVEPKSRNPARTFDHHNLIVSALDSDQLSRLAAADRFGGHAKRNWFHAERFIHPLRPDCRNFFHYELSGFVVPRQELSRRDWKRARLTLLRLNLNAPLLVNRRRHWLQEVQTLVLEFAENTEALRNLAECELLPTAGRLRPFHSALRQLFGGLGEQVIAASGIRDL